VDELRRSVRAAEKDRVHIVTMSLVVNAAVAAAETQLYDQCTVNIIEKLESFYAGH